jgi:SAM-dependent methyltransferase
VLREIVTRFAQTVRTEGVGAACSRAFHVISREILKQPADPFDAARGTDTARIVDLWRLSIPYKTANVGQRYQAVDPERFDEAMANLPINFQEFTFVDMGCGKGRALIMACEKGFRRVIGVEFSAALVDFAQRNLDTLGFLHVELVTGDAAEFIFPDEPLVLFLYNPFGASVLEVVLDHLAERSAYLVYVSPLQAAVVNARMELLYTGHAVRIWATRRMKRLEQSGRASLVKE